MTFCKSRHYPDGFLKVWTAKKKKKKKMKSDFFQIWFKKHIWKWFEMQFQLDIYGCSLSMRHTTITPKPITEMSKDTTPLAAQWSWPWLQHRTSYQSPPSLSFSCAMGEFCTTTRQALIWRVRWSTSTFPATILKALHWYIYIVTNTTHTDRLVMSGHTNSIWSLAINSAPSLPEKI